MFELKCLNCGNHIPTYFDTTHVNAIAIKCPVCHKENRYVLRVSDKPQRTRYVENKPVPKYYCRICGKEISQSEYRSHDEMCEWCEDNEEMDEDEDFGIAPHY